MVTRFRDRFDAGRQLATRLAPYALDASVLVLALPSTTASSRASGSRPTSSRR